MFNRMDYTWIERERERKRERKKKEFEKIHSELVTNEADQFR